MLGLRRHGSLDFTYMHELVFEYGIISKNLLYSYMARIGIQRKYRAKFIKRLAGVCADRDNQQQDYIMMPELQEFPLPMQRERARCLWVLFDYLDKVDCHYRLEYPPSVIGMELDGKDYEIICVAPGKEREALSLLRANRYEIVKKMSFAGLQGFLLDRERGMAEQIRYIAVIEREEQIQRLRYEHIYMFAIVDKDGNIRYFVPEWTTTMEGMENDDYQVL